MSCSSCWTLYGFSPLRAALERRERLVDRARRPRRRRRVPRRCSCANCAAYSPARLPKTMQVGQRVAAETIGAVDARRALARGEQARDRRHLRVGIDADAAHDVVRRRPDFHRLLRDVEVGELLELVIHARELALDVLLGVRELLLDPRDVEKHAAVRDSAPGLDLAVDAARHVIAREQLRRTARALVALRVAPAFFRDPPRSAACSCPGCRRT